jgi:hypothetical protein
MKNRPSGLKYNIKKKNKAWFSKGVTPWNKGVAPKESTRKLWSSQRKGRRMSPSTEFKTSDTLGENNVNWKGGITPLNCQIRHSFKYRQWRSDVFTRDDFTCQECGQVGGNLNAHHIKKFYKILELYKIVSFEDAMACEELWNINNGQTLCFECHEKKGKK